MPITKELSNIRKLEAVGFPHEQAEVLTDIIEESHVDGQQSLKDFISRMPSAAFGRNQKGDF
ncbi:hypothetical protein [Candidatus Kuenenia stuttgartiensis]|uniref:Uncharacterized protein n=1 Tax=Kuenenia stuttgartiensis TaxID=174633 RepID=A0A2C9CDA1_KUEST|nr:hypothetical protein [Candidatus Kuenenia stuttgartiensis]MCL4728151.1 hypothetical protein [Candidatus Kuenenia stuttgartiensis]SOH02707.1 hypothetical protein KSMBR1_0190 [Candidatus Kuenenia stuttgartiensis]